MKKLQSTAYLLGALMDARDEVIELRSREDTLVGALIDFDYSTCGERESWPFTGLIWIKSVNVGCQDPQEYKHEILGVTADGWLVLLTRALYGPDLWQELVDKERVFLPEGSDLQEA